MPTREPHEKVIKKPTTTPSGFERRPKNELSFDECAAIVIDNLIAKIEVNIPNEDINIQEYEEDWKQELWVWCWEHRLSDANLNTLIVNYNALPPHDYRFRMRNIFTRMRNYIVSYVMKLKYSCNDIAKYHVNDKYMKEIPYTSVNTTMSDSIDILDPEEELIESERKEIANYFINEFAKYNTSMYSRHQKVLQMRYGFNDENRIYTLQEVANHLGVTKERVRRMELWALRHCRHVARQEHITL